MKAMREGVRVFLLPALMAGLLAGGCAGETEPTAEAVPAPLGAAGGIVVQPEEFKAYVREQYHVGVEGLSEERRRTFLEWLLVRKALAAEAERKGLSADQHLERTLLEWKLRNYPDFYWKTQVEDTMEVTEEELRAFVDPQEYFQISVIVLDKSEEGREEAWEIHGILETGKDFSTVARERSRGLLAAKGGDMDWQPLPNYSINEKNAPSIRALKPGEYTEPLESEIGWLIYHLRDYLSADQDYAQQQEKMRSQLLGEKLAEERKRRKKELRENADVVIHLGEEGPVPGAPLAVVNGYAVLSESLIQTHAFQDVYPLEQKLEMFISSFILVTEVERLGLDSELAERLAYVRMKNLAEMTIDEAIRERVEVTDEQVEAEYRRSYLPEIYELQIVRTGTREEARKALGEIEGGEDFGAVSVKYSPEQVGMNKGLLPSMPLTDFTDEGKRAVEALEDGGHTGVLKNAEGIFLIVKRISMKTVELPPLEAAERRIRKKLSLQQRGDLARDHLREFTAGLNLEINDEALRELN